MKWDFSVVWNNISVLGQALWVTFFVSFLSVLIGTFLGFLVGVGLLSTNCALKAICRTFMELFLALPPLVLIIWLYYCLPLLNKHFIFSGVLVSVLGLGLSLSAFVAQIVMAGINIVPKGQLEVAQCLGLSRFQSIFYILLPQAARKMLPPLMGQYITCYKLSTLASFVAVDELLHAGNTLISNSYRPLEIYTAIAVIFLITVLPMNYLASKLENTNRFGGVEKI